jgi:hypothetical protein
VGATVSHTGGSGKPPHPQHAHAAVSLDPGLIKANVADAPYPEPIPWKGTIGAIAPIDRDTSWAVAPLVAPARAPVSPPPSASAPAAALGSQAKGCGSGSCGCASKASETSASITSVSANATPTRHAAASVSIPSIPAGIAGKPAKPAKIDPKRPGSGIPARKVIRGLVWARRFAQIFFFALFCYFLFQTGFRGSFAAKSDAVIRLPLPVEAFLLADPFVAAMTVLSTHTVYRGLLWSLGLLAFTLVFGRVFCGWICPFGTLHHFFAWIWPSKVGRGGSRVEANKTHTYQRVKYYLLYAFLVAGVAGSAIGGLFDPICIAVRSIGLGVIPAVQYLAGRGLGAAQEVHSRPLQSAADHTQDFLSQTVWQSRQFHFHQTWLVLFLFVGLLFANRFIPRFWCRVLCPLGAFLGVFARFALFGMEKDHAKCTDCNLCLVNCQGADSPQGGVK